MDEFARACRRGKSYSEINKGSDYTEDEFEFLKAIDNYKRIFKRPFPTWQEVLAVLKSLGYRKSKY